MRVIYTSAYYRGLETLLDIWPIIHKECPKSVLDVYYGWGSWDALEGANGQELKNRITSKLEVLKNQGVTEHGRISHKQLAKELKKSDVLAYPSEFPEISMISMMKAMAAGCIPVSTGFAAVKETQAGFGVTIDSKNVYSNDYAKSKFAKAVINALKNPPSSADKRKQIDYAINTYSWTNVATKWESLMK